MSLKIATTKNAVQNSTININVISITEEKLKLILTDHIKKLRKSKDFLSSASLFVTLVGVLLTADFHVEGVSSDTLHGILFVITLLSFAYFVYVVWNCYKHRDDVDNIMEDIKTYSAISNLDIVDTDAGRRGRRKKK